MASSLQTSIHSEQSSSAVCRNCLVAVIENLGGGYLSTGAGFWELSGGYLELSGS
jgi:hypothetical protein